MIERRVILGFETRITYQVTEWNPPHALSSTREGRPFRWFKSRFTLEEGPDGTTMVATVDMELRLGLQLLWPIVGPFIVRRRRASFGDLKTFLAIIDARTADAEAPTRP